ncbi:hypothetical protein KAH55_04545 [bacterium]|nr:hypothetical protein [bacterium]
MKKTILFLICALVLFQAAILSAQNGVRKIRSIGTAYVYHNDTAHARDQAIDDALRNAVEQALGQWLRSETVVQNYMVVEDNIFSWTSGYVKKYDIISAGKKTDGTYEVTVAAFVEMGALAQDKSNVQQILMQAGNPRVAIMIQEQNVGGSGSVASYFDGTISQAETEMMSHFLDNGFDVVDPEVARSKAQRDMAISALSGDRQAAAAVATQLGAEVLITGKATASVARTSLAVMGNMKSCQANITARAVRADVATLIATASERAAYPHVDEITGGNMALRKATAKLSEKMLQKILAKWRDEYYNQTSVELNVSGAEFADFSDFQGDLSTFFRGIKHVQQRSFAGNGGVLDVKITGSATQLARELDRKELENFNVKIMSLSKNQIHVNLVSRKVVEPDSSHVF